MASDSFIAQLREHYLEPVFRFDYDGSDMSAYIQNIGEIRRDINLMPGYCTVTVDNIDGTWDVFITNHAELTKKGVITFGLSGFATYTASTISFHENGADPDTLEDSASQFVIEGFKKGMVISIAGSDDNDQYVTIDSVTAGVITLIATDDLVAEIEGDSVTIATEEQTLFTGYVVDSDYDHDTRSMTLTMQDRLSLALENKMQYVSSFEVMPVWLNYFDPDSVTRLQAYHLSDLVWFILTEYAKLDNTASTANTDIDYTSWLAWGVDVDNGGYDIYDIGVVSNGESVNDILMKIARLSESVFWCGGEGKIKFMYGRTAGSWRQYTDEIIGVPQIRTSMEDRINYINCKFMYMPDDDSWLSDTSGVVVDSDAGGVTNVPYTYNTDYIQDRVVFHNSDSSAETYMTARLTRTANPPIYVSIVTQLLGFIEDVHSDIALQDLFATPPYDDMGIQINEIVFIPEELETRITGQYY